MVPESMIRELLDHVALHLHGSHDEMAASLRGRFPAIHVTVCSDDDMPSRVPFVAENPHCRLYYVASGEHCLSLTDDADVATGVVLGLIVLVDLRKQADESTVARVVT